MNTIVDLDPLWGRPTEWDPGTVKTVLQHRIPWPCGEGRPLRVSLPPGSVPIYLATLSPKMLELTGEIADGWLGTSFVPEGSAAYFAHLDAGLAPGRPDPGGSGHLPGGRRDGAGDHADRHRGHGAGPAEDLA